MWDRSGALLARCFRRHGGAFLPTAAALVLLRGWSLSLGFAWGVARPLARLDASVVPLEPSVVPSEAEAPLELLLVEVAGRASEGGAINGSAFEEGPRSEEIVEGESEEVRVFDSTP